MSAMRQSPESEILIEAATTAYRERDSYGRIQPSSAWADLTAEQRIELFENQIAARLVEQAADEQGLSSTCRVVLETAARLSQVGGGQ